MKTEIKNRFTAQIILEGDYESVKNCLEKNRGAYLGDAYLRDAKNYLDSHDIFTEIVHRQPVSVFTDVEWSAIAQIIIHRLCWTSIKKRFNDIAPNIFKILAEAGFDEWLKYWETLK